MKSEPDTFSIDDLKRLKTEAWDGVRNFQVRNMFRDDMGVGDRALFYHSNTKEIGVVGEMSINKPATADPTQFDSKSDYFDKTASKDNPRWLAPTVKFIQKFKRVISLEAIKTERVFADSALTRKGSRLSVVQLTKAQYDRVLQLASRK